MKYLKKAVSIVFLILALCIFLLVPIQYDLIKRLWNTGPSYTYMEASSCYSIDNNKILITKGKYKEALSFARDSIESLKRNYNIPGLAICIAVNDTIIWNEGFGCKDVSKQENVNTSTLFKVGSISKSMTGIALLRLIEEQRLSLDQTVEEILPEFPKKKYDIKLKQLAAHQSGIRHYEGTEMLSNIAYETIKASLNIFKNDALLFEPGTDFNYSTYNYTLLSRIIEKSSDQNYLDYMQNQIFKSLRMNSTIPDEKIVKSIGYSSGLNNSNIKKAIEVDVSNKWAGGGYLSTPKDLVLMLKNLDTLLTKESQKNLFTPLKYKNGEDTGADYAIGFRRTFLPKTNKTLIHHGGSSIGGRAFLLKVVEDNIIIAICANSDTGVLRPNNYDLQEVYDIAKLFREKI